MSSPLMRSSANPAVLRRSLWHDVQYVATTARGPVSGFTDGARAGVAVGPGTPGAADCGNTHATAPSQRAGMMNSLFFTAKDHRLSLAGCAACLAFSSARAALRMFRKP